MKSIRLIAIGAVALAAAFASAQQNYNAGTMNFTRTGHNQWGKPGDYGLTQYTKSTDRNDVDIPLGLFVSPLDVTSGAGLVINVGGSIGIRFDIWGKGGTLTVIHPCGIILTYPDPKTLRPGDPFTISSSFSRVGTGSMSSTKPEFGFSLGAFADISVKADVKVIFLDSDVVSENIFNKSIHADVGLFHTDLPGFKELVNANAGHFEFFNGIVEGEWGFPEVTTSGGNGPGDSLTSTGTDAFIEMSVSITDAIIALLGLPIDLNGQHNFDGSWGHANFGLHILDLMLTGALSIQQDFKFDPRPIVELTLSNGQKHIFHAGESINLTMPSPDPNNSSSNNLVVTPTFSMEGQVNNHSKLVFDAGLVFDPFSFSYDIDIIDIISGSGTFHIIDPIVIWDTQLSIDLVDKNFDMKGFNAITKAPFTIEGFQYPGATVGVLSPQYVALNSGAVNLSVKGSNFVADYTNGSGTVKGSTVRLAGGDRVTTFVNAGELTAQITAADTSTEGKKQITVFNPPPGGGVSNPLDFIVDGSAPTITAAANPSLLANNSNPKVLITVKITGKITDLLSGVDVTTGTFAVTDEYGQVQPTGAVTIYPNGDYSFDVRLAPTRQAKDKDGRKYTITVKAMDRLGFQGTGTTTVTVPQ